MYEVLAFEHVGRNLPIDIAQWCWLRTSNQKVSERADFARTAKQ